MMILRIGVIYIANEVCNLSVRLPNKNNNKYKRIQHHTETYFFLTSVGKASQSHVDWMTLNATWLWTTRVTNHRANLYCGVFTLGIIESVKMLLLIAKWLQARCCDQRTRAISRLKFMYARMLSDRNFRYLCFYNSWKWLFGLMNWYLAQRLNLLLGRGQGKG